MPEDIDPEDIKARLFALDGLHDLTTLWIEVDGYSVQCSQVDPRPDDVAFLPLGETEGCLAKYERVTDVRAFRGTTPVFAHTPKAKEPAHAEAI